MKKVLRLFIKVMTIAAFMWVIILQYFITDNGVTLNEPNKLIAWVEMLVWTVAFIVYLKMDKEENKKEVKS